MITAETQQGLIELETTDTVLRIGVYGTLVKDGKVLVVKSHSDNWELPGGGTENGETLSQTLRRELKEEVGIDITVGRMFYMRESFYHSPSGRTYHSLQCFFIVTTTQQPRAGDIKEAAFVSFDELTEENTNASTYKAIKNITDGVEYSLWNSGN
ncbi:NUDIX domain-containing protein [Streptomyces sp. NPDC006996]|uniref:NUDIX domain-containing protein n=1 Tax=Streptomyces sp. NPDC006996 TaxID=3156908 RepID=UPI0033CC7BA7